MLYSFIQELSLLFWMSLLIKLFFQFWVYYTRHKKRHYKKTLPVITPTPFKINLFTILSASVKRFGMSCIWDFFNCQNFWNKHEVLQLLCIEDLWCTQGEKDFCQFSSFNLLRGRHWSKSVPRREEGSTGKYSMRSWPIAGILLYSPTWVKVQILGKPSKRRKNQNVIFSQLAQTPPP